MTLYSKMYGIGAYAGSDSEAYDLAEEYAETAGTDAYDLAEEYAGAESSETYNFCDEKATPSSGPYDLAAEYTAVGSGPYVLDSLDAEYPDGAERAGLTSVNASMQAKMAKVCVRIKKTINYLTIHIRSYDIVNIL